MLPMFLVLATFVLISLYCWRKLLPYFKFPNHFWVDWSLIHAVMFGTKSDKETVIFQKFDTLCRKHESEEVFIVWMIQPSLVVVGEEAMKFFSNETSLIDKPDIFYNVFKFMGETAIFVSSGKRFKATKKMIMAAFYPNVIKGIVPIMNHHAKLLTQTLDETKGLATDQIEIILKNNILRAFLDSSFGIKSDSEENKAKINKVVKLFLRLLAIATIRLYSPWLHKDFMLKFSKIGREYFKLKAELDCIMSEMLEDIKENVLSRKESMKPLEVNSNNKFSYKKSLGEVLIEQHLKDPSFDLEEVKNQLSGILTGGYDTTSQTLSWCFWLLGHHQDVQQKAYEEAMTITNEDVEFEDGRSLTYLECIIKETLRLYPAAPLYGRISKRDIIYGKRKVPKGTAVGLCIYYMHRNPKLYNNPEDFVPERFAGEDSNIKPWTFMPFAEGARSCIGKNYSMLQMKIVLCHVLRKFKIVSFGHPKDIQLVFQIILKSAKPLRVKFLPR